METTTFTAPDIVCGGCATAIQRVLGALPGVSQATVDIQTKAVTVQHAPTVSQETLRATLDKAGFPVVAVA
jgi:copper chaperone CopZ